MKINNKYISRPIRFLGIYQLDEWNIKVYSISSKQERVNESDVQLVKEHLREWLKHSEDYQLPYYKIATLILHEFKEGLFAVINWWIDENMLQNFVYLKEQDSNDYILYSTNGICTCVWEMAIWWHERNAWVKHILMRNENPDVEAYLSEQLNQDI